MREEIQQLLKEVSGELKQLQAQLEAANDQTAPAAGTSADPQLYEPPMPLDLVRSSSGQALPVQVETDAGRTQKTRPGGGAGQASGEMANAVPQAEREPAQLSDEPREEPSVSRQPVPPEYRDIFDRLHHRTQQPGETH